MYLKVEDGSKALEQLRMKAKTVVQCRSIELRSVGFVCNKGRDQSNTVREESKVVCNRTGSQNQNFLVFRRTRVCILCMKGMRRTCR